MESVVSIVSIQADQSRLKHATGGRHSCFNVSIVSIQADQSRHPDVVRLGVQYKEKFQSYQFRQINPDYLSRIYLIAFSIVSIVSIQADQSRRNSRRMELIILYGFNRINSGRSIPTRNGAQLCAMKRNHSFNRINSGRSIPTIVNS